MKKIIVLWLIVLSSFSIVSFSNAYLSDSIKIKADNVLINVHNRVSAKDDEYKISYYKKLLGVINSMKSKYKTWIKRDLLNYIYDDISEKLSVLTIWLSLDTNQDKCYDDKNQIVCPEKWEAFYGQEAQLETNQPSFKDNGDWTVSDLNTGLMWIKDASWKMDYYEWIKSSESFSYAWYDDWRVPSIKELYSLMDFRWEDPNSELKSSEGLIPFVDTDYFGFKYGDISSWDRIIDSQWITTNIYKSKVMNGQECFFWVNFADGRIKCYPTVSKKNNWYYLRYVRWDVYWNNDFVDNWNWTILDKSNWLVWQQGDSEKWMDWKDALSYCEDLELDWYKDWHLPNAKELQYIVDYSKSPDTTDSAAIDSMFKVSEIVNEAWEKDYPYYWTSTTHIKDRLAYDSAVYISFWRALWYMKDFWWWVDVHWAWAQRSDPKSWDASAYPTGHWPQWDAIRIKNYVRCVRNWAKVIEVDSSYKKAYIWSNQDGNSWWNTSPFTPPKEAINACYGRSSWNSCSFNTPKGKLSWVCRDIDEILGCMPR